MNPEKAFKFISLIPPIHASKSESQHTIQHFNILDQSTRSNPTFPPQPPLSRCNRPPHCCTPLPCIQPLLLQLHHLRTLLHHFLPLGQNEFDVAGVRHVGVDLLFMNLVLAQRAHSI